MILEISLADFVSIVDQLLVDKKFSDYDLLEIVKGKIRLHIGKRGRPSKSKIEVPDGVSDVKQYKRKIYNQRYLRKRMMRKFIDDGMNISPDVPQEK